MFDLTVYEEKTLFITGATGLIGKRIIRALVEHNKMSVKKIKIIALVRNEDKARKLFSDLIFKQIDFIYSDICALKSQNMHIDYIIHCASKTSSKDFINEPVETAMTSINGIVRVLDFARNNPVKGVLFLSTMEVYGAPVTDEKISENYASNLDTLKVRSCYPESKRMCENLCVSYAAEYNVPVKIARLTQTFGPGVDYNDSRVFAEFARCAIENRSIVLNTTGETKRSYLYIDDAVDAIFTILQKGEIGKAYNVANEETYCSIYEMAELVANYCANSTIDVEVRCQNATEQLGYAPTLKMNLATDELQKLGWKAKVNLLDSYKLMIKEMQDDAGISSDLSGR